MRPAQKNNPRWRFWIVREQAEFNFRSALLSIRTWSFDCYRFTEANPFRSFFTFPNDGKVHLYVYVASGDDGGNCGLERSERSRDSW